MKIARLAVLTLAGIILSGCGAPYQSEFQEWLGTKYAKETPLRLVSLKTEEVQGGEKETVFQFEGQLEFTEDLFKVIQPLNISGMKTARNSARAVGMSDDDIAQIEQNLTEEFTVTIVQKTAKKGEKIPISGKASAMRNGEGRWDFFVLEAVGGTIEGSKPPQGKWLEIGTQEAKKHIESTNQKIEANVKAVADQVVIKEKERAEQAAKIAAGKAEEEARLKKERDDQIALSLSLFEPGKSLSGIWNESEYISARGNFAISFTHRVEAGDKMIVEGYLFDPANPNHRKPFSGQSSGTGLVSDPFVLDLQTSDSGVSVTDITSLKKSTLGLLYEGANYPFRLKIFPDRKEVRGTITGTGRLFGGRWTLDLSFIFNDQIAVSTQSLPQTVNGSITAGGGSFGGEGGHGRAFPIEPQDYDVAKKQAQLAAPLLTAIQAAYKAGQGQVAVQLSEQLIKLYPQSPQAMTLLLISTKKAGKLDAAKDIYQLLMQYPLSESDKQELERIWNSSN